MALLLCSVIIALLGSAALADPAVPGVDASKKIIKLGWDEPDPDLMLSRINSMEAHGFDGVVFSALARTVAGNMNFSNQFWGKKAFTEQELAHSLQTLNKIPFKRFTDNFLRVNVIPGDVDWFDPAFDSVIQNARMAGKLVKAARARGIFLDDEMYLGQIFFYRGVNPDLDKSFEETCAQVRHCGKRFIEALQSEVDSPVIILTFAWSASSLPDKDTMEREARRWMEPFREAYEEGDRERLLREAGWLLETASAAKTLPLKSSLEELQSLPRDANPDTVSNAIQQVQEEYKRLQYERLDFGLLPDFLDGMVEGATGNTEFVDGYELAYGYRTDEEYAKGRADMLASVKRSSIPDACAKRLRVGFAVYMDQGWPTLGWHVDDPEKNRLSPLEFEFCLNRAMAHSDKYVWSYSEQPNWWTGDKLPKGYADALKQSRAAHNPNWTTSRILPADPTPTQKPDAVDASANDVDRIYTPLLTSYDFIQDLPIEWRFKPDRDKTGNTQGWDQAGYDIARWSTIRVDQLWDDQGFDIAEGYGWYATELNIPENLKGRDLYLAFGAVDEAAVVYVNGNVAHRFGLPGKTWDLSFEARITPYVTFGKANTVTVRVENAVGKGGIWRPVRLVAKKPE